MKINLHAGHNPDGKIACGAVGILKESTEARNLKNIVMSKLQGMGHTVYDCTEDNGKNQNDVLTKIVNKCNAHTVDLDVSIHFNSGANDKKGNGKTTGTEVLIYNSSSKAKTYAQRIANAISAVGFKNRGVKTNSSLYFLRKAKSPALLIEVCFVDDYDDATYYKKHISDVAQAIVNAITGGTTVAQTGGIKYVYGGVDYSPVFNATYYAEHQRDVVTALGSNASVLFNHFCTCGMKEGRQANSSFNVTAYKNRYKDLQQAFGNNLPLYYKHYCTNGKSEGRIAV